MEGKILYLSNVYPQAEETLLNAIEAYKRGINFLDEIKFYVDDLQDEIESRREKFEEQFNSTFDEANDNETFIDLSLPSKEIQRIDNKLEIFLRDIKRPLYLIEDLNRIEARLVDIAMEEQE